MDAVGSDVRLKLWRPRPKTNLNLGSSVNLDTLSQIELNFLETIS